MALPVERDPLCGCLKQYDGLRIVNHMCLVHGSSPSYEEAVKRQALLAELRAEQAPARTEVVLTHLVGDGVLAAHDPATSHDECNCTPRLVLHPEAWDDLGRPTSVVVTVEPAGP